MICSSTDRRKEGLRFIYLSWKNKARAILLESGAQESDVNDAIQEAIVILDNHIRHKKYKKQSSLKNYFIGICKKRIYSNLRSVRRFEWTDDQMKLDGMEDSEPETLMLNKEEKEILDSLLQMLDKKCHEILKLYRLSYPMKQIAEELDLENANNTRQWVLRCRKRLSDIVAKNPFYSNYFKDQ